MTAPVHAVRVHIADADFFLLPEADTPDGAAELVERLDELRSGGGQLRLRPRTAPPDDENEHLTGHEDPGTSWRDVLGEAIGETSAVDYERTMALWHWAIETRGEHDFEVG